MSHEFEDQHEGKGLGELPEDISGDRERDEFASYAKRGEANSGHTSVGDRSGIPGPLHPAVGIPTDVEVEDNIRGVAGDTKSPGIPAGTTTVYDARPINGRDFMHTEIAAITADLDNTGGDILTANFSFTIPQGFVGVLRGFSYQPDVFAEFAPDFFIQTNDTSTPTFVPVTSSLLINELTVPEYDSMDLGQAVEPFFPTFALGLGGQQFKLRITYDRDVAVGAVCSVDNLKTFGVRGQLYGNLLLSRGLPRQFEIATQQYSGRIK